MVLCRLLIFALSLLSGANANAVIRRAPSQANNVIVQVITSLHLSFLFAHPASAIRMAMGECSGRMHEFPRPLWIWLRAITGNQWWTDYQPVSYTLTSKRGTRAQYANMVSTCAAAGVGIIQDVVMNHMTAGSGVGFAGNSYSKYSYPAVPYTSSNFHYCAGNGEAAQVTDLQNVTNVRLCELDGLADLAQEQPAVQKALTAYLEDLVSLVSSISLPSLVPSSVPPWYDADSDMPSQGVAGFRVDAAAYMEPSNLSALYSALSGSPYRTQEVYDGGASDPAMYDTIGDVSNLVTPVPMNTAWDLIPSNVANFIIANQDTERSSPGDSLNYLSPNNAYTLGMIFMLGFNYGTPTVFSGYDFATNDIGAPQAANGTTSPVTCYENGWRCEQEWMSTANMVLYHNAVGSADLTNVIVGTEQQVAFGRGSIGFLVINNDINTWSATFQTSLPAGTYCDIMYVPVALLSLSTSSNLNCSHDTDSAPTTCSGPSYIVSSSGQFTASVGAYDALAIFSADAAVGFS
ncbi:glycoside hydrolase superfamily [Mycena metata]|uniref:alpha-amylase n=1 Tax=Mycena metata TaxID=1033252 RepID=A0AAD7NAD9_9AGAR|nr:glycoside hydrolase superfamily [Mycena metata]